MHHHRLLFFLMPYHRRGHRTNPRPLMLVLAIVAALLALLIVIGMIGSAWTTAHTPDPAQVQIRALAIMPTIALSGSAFDAQDTSNNLTVYETLPSGLASPSWTVQQDCYSVQSALWQDSQINGVASIQLDIYQGNREIAICDLSQQTARHGINAAADVAWSEYDTAWMAPGI